MPCATTRWPRRSKATTCSSPNRRRPSTLFACGTAGRRSWTSLRSSPDSSSKNASRGTTARRSTPAPPAMSRSTYAPGSRLPTQSREHDPSACADHRDSRRGPLPGRGRRVEPAADLAIRPPSGIAFAGHAVFCVEDDVSDARIRELSADGYGGATNAYLMTAIAGAGGWVGSHDALMVARGTGPQNARAAEPDTNALVLRPDLAGHSRVEYARRTRDELQVFGFPDKTREAVLIVARGVAGLPELSYELEPGRHGRGEGRALAAAGLQQIPRGQVVVACVAPGNAASLRSLLAAGFAPVGALQLLRRAEDLSDRAGASWGAPSSGSTT